MILGLYLNHSFELELEIYCTRLSLVYRDLTEI